MKNRFLILFGLAALIIFLLPINITAVETLIRYPEIGGEKIYWGMTLPQIIRYLYLFAMGICGAVALTAILLGAIKYISAAGNASKMSDAKDQIFSAILGVVILLSSYLILNTINPDLVTLKEPAEIGQVSGSGRCCYCIFEGWENEPVLDECFPSNNACSQNCWAACSYWEAINSKCMD